MYEILAIKYAEKINRIRADNFIMDDDHDAPHPMDYFIWVIRNDQTTIVVDTGFDGAEAHKRGRQLLREPHVALRLLGIDAAKINEVVITHLHYDHAGTLGAFPNARFHLQDAEMAYATGPCMCYHAMRLPFTADHVCDMVRNVYSGRVIFHDGEAEIAPGISLHKIGGHSRGLQAVRIATPHGPVVLASDAAHYYETFEKEKPFPLVADMEDMIKGYRTITALAGGGQRVVPGHDPLVLERYPAFNTTTSGIVARLELPRLR